MVDAGRFDAYVDRDDRPRPRDPTRSKRIASSASILTSALGLVLGTRQGPTMTRSSAAFAVAGLFDLLLS
jgi:hypothetical protein